MIRIWKRVLPGVRVKMNRFIFWLINVFSNNFNIINLALFNIYGGIYRFKKKFKKYSLEIYPSVYSCFHFFEIKETRPRHFNTLLVQNAWFFFQSGTYSRKTYTIMLELEAVFWKVTGDSFSVLKECRFICTSGKPRIHLEDTKVYKEIAKRKNAWKSFIKTHLAYACVIKDHENHDSFYHKT